LKGKKEKKKTEFEQKFEEYKYEVAQELGIAQRVEEVGWKNLSARECGRIGGKMGGKIGGELVRRMIAKEKARQGRT
jgi:hypothetical protein